MVLNYKASEYKLKLFTRCYITKVVLVDVGYEGVGRYVTGQTDKG